MDTIQNQRCDEIRQRTLINYIAPQNTVYVPQMYDISGVTMRDDITE